VKERPPLVRSSQVNCQIPATRIVQELDCFRTALRAAALGLALVESVNSEENCQITVLGGDRNRSACGLVPGE
jgi:hypothetical protein